VKTTLIAAAILLTLTRAWAGQPGPTPANWGQADTSDWNCPLTTGVDNPPPIYTPMPVGVALTTSGGPVLASVNLTSSTNSASPRLLLRFTVGGVPVGPTVEFLTGHLRLESETRILPIQAGSHSIGVSLACLTGGDAVTIEQAWLSVYELPTIPK
jgi:hypothetical protein